MENYLTELIKKMKGNMLGIGITNEKMLNAIQENNQITDCQLLNEIDKKFNKKKFEINIRGKKINIKKLRKNFKKKRIENLICNYDSIEKFLKTFIKDSVYINKGKLYIYGDKTDLETVIKRYKRYTENIELKEEKDKFVLIIDNSNSQNNRLKDIGYWWLDTGTSFVDFLTIILVN